MAARHRVVTAWLRLQLDDHASTNVGLGVGIGALDSVYLGVSACHYNPIANGNRARDCHHDRDGWKVDLHTNVDYLMSSSSRPFNAC